MPRGIFVAGSTRDVGSLPGRKIAFVFELEESKIESNETRFTMAWFEEFLNLFSCKIYGKELVFSYASF